MEKNAEFINMVSDVVTLPTPKMREAMSKAECGDDVAREDPTVNRLEEMAAQITGKEAAIYVASGTMGNLLALLSHCERGQEVILEKGSHINYYEVGGIGCVAGLIPNCIEGKNGIMDPEDVRNAFREENIHYPKTGLICLENSHNRGGGTVIPLDNLAEIRKIADEHHVPVHMDGARLFNAAAYLNVPVQEITKYTDSVSFCLSKGLSAPVGSLLCGTKEFVDKARGYRKMLGGGMRQAGVIAAAGIVALETMVERLKEDHDNARLFGSIICEAEGITLDINTVETNLVVFDVEKSGMTAQTFVEAVRSRYNVAMQARPPYGVRAVTHRHISKEDAVSGAKAVIEVVKG